MASEQWDIFTAMNNGGNAVLSTTFSQNQHGSIAGGHLFDKIKNSFHCQALSNNPFKVWLSLFWRFLFRICTTFLMIFSLFFPKICLLSLRNQLKSM